MASQYQQAQLGADLAFYSIAFSISRFQEKLTDSKTGQGKYKPGTCCCVEMLEESWDMSKEH